MDYKNQLEKTSIYSDEIDNHENNYNKYLKLDDAKEIIDDIFGRVDTILDQLLPVKGLNEIDEIREKVKELKGDLY